MKRCMRAEICGKRSEAAGYSVLSRSNIQVSISFFIKGIVVSYPPYFKGVHRIVVNSVPPLGHFKDASATEVRVSDRPWSAAVGEESTYLSSSLWSDKPELARAARLASAGAVA